MTWFVLTSLVVLLIFGLFYPTHFLIADELGYFEQALKLAGATDQSAPCTSCLAAFRSNPIDTYPAGTALLAAVAISLGGPKAVFWLSMVLSLLGYWAMGWSLREHHKPMTWALYPALFLPGLVLTRTLMSDVPSFTLAAIFLYFFFKNPKNRWFQLVAGVAAGLALLFRETNLLWGLPFLAGAFIRQSHQRYWLAAGFLFGGLMRAAVAWKVFGDPFFVKDPGIGFSASALPANLGFYLLVLSVLCPGGLWWWWKSRHPFKTETGISIALFLLVYSLYGYEAFGKSGYKGLFLQARFMFPLLPFLTWSAANSDFNFSKKKQQSLFGAAIALFLCVQIAGWQYNREQSKLTQILQDINPATSISFTPDDSRKYLNGLYGAYCMIDGTQVSRSDLNCGSTWYVHTITRAESADRKAKAQAAELAVEEKFNGWYKRRVANQRIFDGTRLQVWEVQNSDEREQKR